MAEDKQTVTEGAIGASSAESAVFTDLLAAETTLKRLGDEMASEFVKHSDYWPRDWMEKHAKDRQVLIDARRVLIERAEAANAMEVRGWRPGNETSVNTIFD